MTNSSTQDNRPHLVVLGSGFGALQCIRTLKSADFRVTVISPRNHFLFTPLLIGTTVGTVEDRNITEPVRTRRSGSEFCQATCEEIDADTKQLHCRSPLDESFFTMGYDQLVIAVGGQNSTFGIKGVREHAFFLKEVTDARAIRRRILGCLERASLPETSEQTRNQILHWVVVGGGPTGTEFAGELFDFLKDARDAYPKVAPQVNITLLEAAEDILPSFDQALRDYAVKRFQREGIEVRSESPAKEVLEDRVILESGEEIPCGLVVWSTGIVPRSLVEKCDLPKTEKGFLRTDDCCRVVGHDDIYAIGDTARTEERSYPATAQLAQQQGRYLGKALTRSARGKEINPFRFHNLGTLAYIGSRRALADLPVGKVKGRTAWLFWRSVYLTKLVGLRNKLNLLGDWIDTRIFGRDISRFP